MKKALSYKLEQFILKYVWVGVLKGAVTWCTCANFFLYAINSCAYLNKIISANTIISRKKTNRCTSSGNLWVNSLLYMTRYSNYSVCTNTKKFVMMKDIFVLFLVQLILGALICLCGDEKVKLLFWMKHSHWDEKFRHSSKWLFHSLFLLFRQWKLEDLCYKSGEVVTETHHLNQVRHNQHSVYSFSVFYFLSLYCCYFFSVCQFYYLLNHLDHRKATSLPHHHTFGLLLGGG